MSNAKDFQDDVGFDDTTSIVKFSKYTGTEGHTDRLGFCFINPTTGKPIVRKAETNFIQGVGYVKYKPEFGDKFGAKKGRYATIVIHYRTSRLGKIESLDADSVTCKYLVLSESQYEELKVINAEHDLEKHDITVSTEKKGRFLNLKFFPCKEAAWLLKPEVKAAVEAQVAKLAANLSNQFGQDLTEAQIKEKLGVSDIVSGGATESSAGAEAETDDIIASL